VPGGDRFLQPQRVVDPSVDPLQRPGFKREPPWLAVAKVARPSGIAAPSLRDRHRGDPHALGDRRAVEPHGNAYRVANCMDGHSALGIAGTSAHME
jgi:hypothetical protein